MRVTTSSRASILPPSPSIDPYDLMRRSRLSCPDVGSQFRARSTSPSKSRSNLDLRNYSSTRTKSQNPNRTRSPSPAKNSVLGGRRSILECDVNPYELMSTDSEAKQKVTQNGKSNGFKNYLNNDYEDVETTSKNTSNKLISQIPKLQNKLKKSSPAASNLGSRRTFSNERENHILRNEAKFKSILKKPSSTFGDTDLNSSVVENSSGSKSGSHFYLPMPTLTPPRKKVQFLVENETEEQFEGNNDRMESNAMRDEELAAFTSPPSPPTLAIAIAAAAADAVGVGVGATLESKGNADLVARESIDKQSNEIHQQLEGLISHFFQTRACYEYFNKIPLYNLRQQSTVRVQKAISHISDI